MLMEVRGDECDEEAMQTRRLLQELGFTGVGVLGLAIADAWGTITEWSFQFVYLHAFPLSSEAYCGFANCT